MCNFWHSSTLTLSPERQSARMTKITNDGLTRSDTGCSIAVPNTHMATVGVKGLTLYQRQSPSTEITVRDARERRPMLWLRCETWPWLLTAAWLVSLCSSSLEGLYSVRPVANISQLPRSRFSGTALFPAKYTLRLNRICIYQAGIGAYKYTSN